MRSKIASRSAARSAACRDRLNLQRHAPFFAAFRDGIADVCRRVDPRIGLLTPGRFTPSYAEQAHLARYLGFLLVEGADLAALEDRLYVRTIAGLKRLDALWRRVDPRMLDPLAFDSHSQIGVPGLIDAYAAGEVVLLNAPGSGLLEVPALGRVPSGSVGAADRRRAASAQHRDVVVRPARSARAGRVRTRSPDDRARVRRHAARPARRPCGRGRRFERGSARDAARRHGAASAGLCRTGDRPPVDDAGGDR